jgi:hypothetical protein
VNNPKNGAKEELPRIEPLTSRFPLSDLDLDFFTRKIQSKVHKHCKTVNSAFAYHYILLLPDMSWFETIRTIIFSRFVTVISTIVIWTICTLKLHMTDAFTISEFTFELAAEQCILFWFFILLFFHRLHVQSLETQAQLCSYLFNT